MTAMNGIDVEVVETSSLGDRSYLAHDGQVAVVVDPQRDIDRVLALAGRLGVRITHVAETHLHNDYVSGGLALAKLTGARYLIAAADEVGFDRLPVADGDRVSVSEAMRLRVVATPGHTFHHLSFVLHTPDGPAGVFTGGSLLFGTTGRTDLLGGQHAHALAGRQHESVRRLADLLPDGARVWPTHGFGSFCSATQSDASASTVGRERQGEPGAAPGDRRVRYRNPRRTGPVPGVLRAHGGPERRGCRPDRPHPGPAGGPGRVARPDRRR